MTAVNQIVTIKHQNLIEFSYNTRRRRRPSRTPPRHRHVRTTSSAVAVVLAQSHPCTRTRAGRSTPCSRWTAAPSTRRPRRSASPARQRPECARVARERHVGGGGTSPQRDDSRERQLRHEDAAPLHPAQNAAGHAALSALASESRSSASASAAIASGASSGSSVQTVGRWLRRSASCCGGGRAGQLSLT